MRHPTQHLEPLVLHPDLSFLEENRERSNLDFCVILAFNKANRMTELCCLILIKNKNTETI